MKLFWLGVITISTKIIKILKYQVKGHLVDCNYSVFACWRKPSKESSLFSDEFEKTHLHVLQRSHAHSSPPEWACAWQSLSFPHLSISSVSSNYKLLCLQDYLSIRGRMKCEKQSEKRQATDTQLQRMQLCQWQIIFWPLSLSLHGWRFATATACFLFSCSLPFCDSQRTSSKMLRCLQEKVLERQHDFVRLLLLHSRFTFVVYVSVSVTFSLFLFRFLCSSSSLVLSLSLFLAL